MVLGGICGVGSGSDIDIYFGGSSLASIVFKYVKAWRN